MRHLQKIGRKSTKSILKSLKKFPQTGAAQINLLALKKTSDQVILVFWDFLELGKSFWAYDNFQLGNDRCPRCNDRVYYAEKVVANGINWHKVFITTSWACDNDIFSVACVVPNAENHWIPQHWMNTKRKSIAKRAMVNALGQKGLDMVLALELFKWLKLDTWLDLVNLDNLLI